VARKKGGRPKKDKNRRLGVQIGLRIKDDLAAMLDTKASELEKVHPGSTWTRNDVVRYMLYKAFESDSKSE
jgi:hypothetical protein